MGQYKDTGSHALALAEECAEVIQVITKLYRFVGDWQNPGDGSTEWDEIPPGKEVSRWDMLEAEMEDVIYHWNQLKSQRKFEKDVFPTLLDIYNANKDLSPDDL
jgi:NTP pyrophosphatase (non-canonical NTP hydrolase)